jgi:BirA family biotin operon repressor/biotin-[acetyl-CoA-carboxylase] ligase
MTIEWRFDVYQKVLSTQNYVHDAIALGEEEGLVVQALQQQGARGRHGNQWDAPIGNLYMSILLRPKCDLAQAGQLAFVIAVALSQALDTYIDPKKHKKTLKWPNDILIDNRKISGILLESDIRENKLNAIVAGIGLNIFKAPDFATDLNQIAKEPVYVNKVRDEFLDKLGETYEIWQEKGFAPIREAWLKQAHGLGNPITARLPDKSYKGVFKGLTDDGSLILDQDGTDRIIHAADVHFGDA